MTNRAISGSALAGITLAALALPAAASAQVVYSAPMSDSEVRSLPPEYRTGPAVADYSETSVDQYGVETITRTRRIETSAPYPGEYAEYEGESHQYGYAPAPAHGYAPAPAVFERDQWLDECERRTSGRGNREKGGIIGGLLGAIAGGIIGNRVADSERLGGTLIGAGVGGIAGVVLGSLIGGGRNDRGDYDCEAALDGYLSQYGHTGRIAAHPAPAYGYAQPAHHGYGYGYAPAYQAYSYSYAPPQQVVYVPVYYEVQQRVIVRETVREEVEIVPGAARVIPAPPPAPLREPIYIKGN